MTIREIVWPKERIEHIARHNVTPREVEEVCFGKPLVQQPHAKGQNPVYYVLGQTDAGVYLFCVIVRLADGKGYPVTARPMTDREKRRYRRRKK
jgi:uncharacterized DUF497 family protein